MSINYTKPALTFDEQINLLESRGLLIPDREKARHYLQFINYYRLSGYTVFFEQVINGKRNHQFVQGTRFDQILELCDFDRQLRVLVIDAIERIEVAIRTQICSQMALAHNNSHWHLRRELFKSEFNYAKFIEKCASEQRNSREPFVDHYKKEYDHPHLVPAWMLAELLPMGTWSLVYNNIAQRSDRKRIADNFKMSQEDLKSCLHTLTYIRNLCAHHSRLWNRSFTIRPKVIKPYQKHLTPNTTFAAQAAIIHILLRVISPDSRWTTKLYTLIQNHSFINPSRMGFSPEWQNDEFWGVK